MFNPNFPNAENLKQAAKKSKRWITCQLCGKTITKASMVSHFYNYHNDDQVCPPTANTGIAGEGGTF